MRINLKDGTPEVVNAEKNFNDAIANLLQCITKLIDARASEYYQQGYNAGWADLKEQVQGVASADEEIEAPAKPRELTLAEEGALLEILRLISTGTDRPNDIVRAITKVSDLTDQVVKVLIGRLRDEGKIKAVAGRCYLTGIKSSTPAYQVLSYTDSNKFIGSDITR